MFLLGIVASATEVDEVEIDVAEFGAAKVAAAEVGFANLLGMLEGADVVVVGVEAGARAFGGDRREEQAAARGAHVEGCAGQIGVTERTVLPVDFAQAGFAQSGSFEVCAAQARRRKKGFGQVGVLKVGGVEVEVFEIATRHVGVPEDGIAANGIAKVQAGQFRPFQFGIREIRALERGASERYSMQDGLGKIR